MTHNHIHLQSSSWPRIALLLTVVILLVASAARFHWLPVQSLWHDEGNSYVQSTRTFFEIADNAARDIHPPGYYWLLKLWRGLLGETEFGLRSFSAFASILSVAFAFALGRTLYGRMAGLVTAALVALNTFSIYYAQEARMYTLLALLSAASMWVFIRLLAVTRHVPDPHADWWQRPAFRWTVILGLLNAAGLYTQYAFPFVMFAQGVLFLLWLGIQIIDARAMALCSLAYYAAASLLALLLFLPWLPTALEQVSTWPNTGQPIPTAEALATIIAYFSFGLTRGTGTTIPVLFFVLFGLLFLPTAAPLTRSEGRKRWWRALVPVVWVIVPVGLFLLMGLFREANLKLLLPAQIGFALWVARGVQVMWTLEVQRESFWQRAVPRVAVLVALMAIAVDLWQGLDPLYTDIAFRRDDYRAIADAITANPRAGDAVILSAPNQQEVFDYYYDGAAPVYALPRGLGGDDEATLTETRSIIDTHQRIYAVLWATAERDPNSVVERTLDAQTYEAGSNWYGDVRLVRYAAPTDFDVVTESGAQFGKHIRLESYALSTDTLTQGDVLQVQLNWQVTDPISMDYKVFVQLVGPDGPPIAQHDSFPVGGQAMTSDWQPGEIINDNHALIVPNDLALANYSLIVGLYNPDDPEERLPVNGQSFLQLTQFQITD